VGASRWKRNAGGPRAHRSAGEARDGRRPRDRPERAWKRGLQDELCDRHGLTVPHYPPGASKWNPTEHRLFSEISKNWSGRPLDGYQSILKSIRSTTTSTGLQIRAHLVRKSYPKGIKIGGSEMRELSVDKLDPLPKWNDTLQLRS
jgi:hypothetical protein